MGSKVSLTVSVRQENISEIHEYLLIQVLRPGPHKLYHGLIGAILFKIIEIHGVSLSRYFSLQNPHKVLHEGNDDSSPVPE